jgi:hypothetical protein
MSENRAQVGLPAVIESGDGAGKGRDLVPQSGSAASSGDSAIVIRPAARQALEEAADEFVKRSVSENTSRSYRSDWESWEAFCCFHGFAPLPADPDQVRLSVRIGRPGSRSCGCVSGGRGCDSK